MTSFAFLSLLGLAAQVSAHGYIQTYTVNGVDFEGFRRLDAPEIPNSIGWSFSTQDEGPVPDPSSPDMICRHDAENAPSSAPIEAGQVVDFDWTSADLERNPDGWSQGHRGPVITYLAACNGDCATVDKSTLRFVKIAEAGLISGPASTEGVWATDLLRQGNNSAMIPTDIAPGNYVIRNEIIALHRANEQEPEFYQSCANLEVTKGGSDDLSGKGVAATELYSREDQQLYAFSIYEANGASWDIPGPAMYQSGSSGSVPDSEGSGPVPDDNEEPETVPDDEEPETVPGDEDSDSTPDEDNSPPIVETPAVPAPPVQTDDYSAPQPCGGRAWKA